MTNIKAYTDVEQSKKLAEILPLESADGFWEYHNKWCSEGDEWEGYEDYPRAEPYLEYTRKENEWKEDKSDVPCWSLAALLEVIKRYTMQTTYRGTVFVKHEEVETIHRFITREYTWCVDACVEMIEWMNINHLL